MVRTFRPECFDDWLSCPIMHILPLILDMDVRNDEHMILPSNFVKEMQLTTEQRYERLIHPTSKSSIIFANLKSFKVVPGILVYQNYDRGAIYSLKLNIINIQDVSKSIQVQMEESTYFSLHYTDTVGTKVAPGLKFTVEVRFSADILTDYKHKITFFTVDEKFEVPILAIGPRPLLDLPDKIVIPRTAINMTTERTIIVQNISPMWANFTLETANGFAVHRSREALKPDECCRVTVFFYAGAEGLNSGVLKIVYETGEVLYVALEVMVEEADLRLSPSKLCFLDCALGLSEEKIVTLFNDSDYIVDFRWISHDCAYCSRQARSAIKEKFVDIMEYQLVRDNKLVYHNILDPDSNQHIYERILDEQKKECDMSQEPLYLDSNFVIAPSSGQIWPKTKNNFSVIYAPKSVDLHKSIAFLDITGRRNAMNIDMFGNCKGPIITINLEELDAQNIYIGSVHRYEVVFKNPGPVSGTVRYQKTESKFGGEFSCSEDTFIINPDELKYIYIEFTSLTRGRFTEVIKFIIVESQEVVSFNIIGTIVSPLLNFNVTNVDFGDLSVGETKRCTLLLENNTQVSIEYQVAILYVSENTSGDDDCSEISCSSNSGVVEPYTKIPYYVEVNPTEAADKRAELAIYMWETRQDSRTVFITYRARVPVLQEVVPNITIKSMFITQSYFRSISIDNKSSYVGNLTIRPWVDNNYLRLNIDITEVFVNSFDSFELRVEIRADVIGDMQGKILGQFSGASQSFTICEIFVSSRGPCIDFTLTDTNLGKIDTLTSIVKQFSLCNDSPIPATVFINIFGQFISALDPVIVVGPEETVESGLKIYGTVSGRFRTTIKLEIEGADSDSVVFTGEFVGGSISVTPHLQPFCEIGAISTLNSFMYDVTFHNEGKVAYMLSLKEFDTAVKSSMSNTAATESPQRPYFIWDRMQLIVLPGKTESITVDCYSKLPCQVSTRFVINAKKQTRRNMITLKIFDFKLKASFEVPHVILSKPYMEFRIDIGTTHTVSVLEDEVVLMNQSSVPLNMDITMDEPFYFNDGGDWINRQFVSLDSGMEMMLLVKFQPDLSEQKCHTRKSTMRILYVNHPAMDKLPLLGIVNYPNVTFEPSFLDFGCIPIGHEGAKMFYLCNNSPLTAEYKLLLKEDLIVIEKVEFCPKDIETESDPGSFDSFHDYMVTEEEYVNNLIKEELLGENYNFEEESAREEESSCSIPPLEKTSSAILNSEECLELAKQTIADDELKETVKDIVFPLLPDSTNDAVCLSRNLMDVVKTDLSKDIIETMIDVVPSSGSIGPYEYIVISVKVCPPPNTKVYATVRCEVAGGATSEFKLVAMSGMMLYHLKSDVIDFGIVPFNEIAETSFPLENIGYATLQFSLQCTNNLTLLETEPGWFQFEPIEGVVEPGKVFPIVVRYFPGYPGYFETTANIEVSSYESVTLTIKGCAVLPQFYFNYPRPLDEEQNVLSYSAIANLTYPNHCHCEEDYTTQIGADYNDWEFVRYKRHYPSPKDIAMAVERQVIQKHLLLNPALVEFKNANPSAIIPDIVFPTYIIDMGYVILNDERTVLITPMRYSDTSIRMYWLRMPRKTLERGFSMVFQKGQSGPFVVFKPTPKLYREINVEASGLISCVINSTIKIDFEVRAMVTVPSLTVQRNIIEYGKVRCGQAMRQALMMKNNGAVPCSYKLVIQSSAERPSNIFFTSARDGVVNAGQYSKINIYFQPQAHMKYEWHLVVSMEENVIPMKITLRGYGVYPDLKIVDEKIIFDPTLPYSNNNVKQFKIVNRSQCPEEICFAEFDKKFQEEAIIVRTLLAYYNVTKLFIPQREVGASLPTVLKDVYHSIIDDLREIIKQRVLKDYLKLASRLDSAISLQSDDVPVISDPLEDKSLLEIQALVMENIAELRLNSYGGMVPKKGSVYEIECESATEEESKAKPEMREGVLIIFHGSPLTEFVLAANAAARALKIPAFNIDQLIYESLVRNEILAANKLNQVISDTYDEIIFNNYIPKMPSDSDIYDILTNKVNLIQLWTLGQKSSKEEVVKLSNVEEEKKSKPGSKAPSVKTSKKAKPVEEKIETFLQLPIELYLEMLTESISKHSTGLIIETLHSLFITSPTLLLVNILKAVGNIRYIHVVYLSCSYRNYEEDRTQIELKSQSVQDQDDTGSGVLQHILQMDDEEFANLDGPDLQMFESVYIGQRKLDTQRRLQERKLQLSDSTARTSTFTERLARKSRAMSKSKVTVDISIPSKPSSKPGKKGGKKKGEEMEVDVGIEVPRSSQEEIYKQLTHAENEANEIRYILENWHRGEKKILDPSAKLSGSNIKEGKGKLPKQSSPKVPPVQDKYDEEMFGEGFGEIMSNVGIVTPKVQEHAELGIPLWFFDNAQTDVKPPLPSRIAEYLSVDHDCSSAMSLAHLASFKERVGSPALFSVLADVTMRNKTTTSVFAIYEPILANSPENKSQILKYQERSSQGKKSTLSRRSSTSLLSLKKSKKPKAKPSKALGNELIPRRIIYPGDEITLEMHFLPDSCGIFNYVYNVDIITIPVPIKIYCEGKADIPRIYMTPAMVFSKVLPERSGHGLVIAYLENEEVFHMGAAAVQDEKNRIECLFVEDKLNFINESYLTCDLSIGFLEETSNFTVDATELKICANNSQFLTVRGHPVQSGNVYGTLVLTCTNNPRVNCIKLSEIGTILAIDINPHDVIFERVLLNRLVKIDMVLRNQGLIGAAWEINFKNIVEKYGVSATNGYIAPLGSNIITFTYEATEYRAVPVEEFDIKFYDKAHHCVQPILCEKIKLSAEVVEVGLECDPIVVLGDIKIDQPFVFTYTFKNTSKFELAATFSALTNDTDLEEFQVIRRGTSMSSTKLLIKPNDITKVPIMFMINVPIQFRAVPIYNVAITDPLINREIMTYTLRVTGKVFSSLYKMCPSDTVKFAAQLIDTEVRVDMILRNVGKYSFNYIIMHLKNEGVKPTKGNKADKISTLASVNSMNKKSVTTSKASKKSAKTQKSKKSKRSDVLKSRSVTMAARKLKPPVFQQGIFSITPASGVVEAHSEVNIQITCKTKKVGLFIEQVMFYISGVTGKYAEGQPLSLEAIACVPEIDFANLEYIFKQHFIFQSQNDALCYEQLVSNSVFIVQDRIFYFKGTCINLESEARIQLRNVGEIGAHVNTLVTSDNTAFRIEPEKLHIEAYNSAYLTIFFKPYSLNRYDAILTLSVEQTSNDFAFGLYGEGCMPVVEIIKPTVSTAVNYYELDFNLVRVAATAEREITFYNSGILSAKVILGLVNDPESLVTMQPVDCQAFNLTDEEASQEVLAAFTKTTIIQVKPKETVNVNVKYCPKVKEKLDAIVNVYIINNPYDNSKIHIAGQGYSEDVVIENLESFILNEPSNTSLSFEIENVCLAYHLNLSYQHVHKFIKKDIKLSNMSKEDTYRFAFKSNDNVSFMPSLGHLLPLTSKDIIVTFFSDEPIDLSNKLQTCELVKIMYTDCNTDNLPWDERQQCIMYTYEENFSIIGSIENHEIKTNLSDVSDLSYIQTKEEPTYEEIPDTSTVIPLMLNAVVDYCAYSLETQELTFPDTQVFETSTLSMFVMNTSSVPMNLHWNVFISNHPKKSFTDGFPSSINMPSSNRRSQSCYQGKRQLGNGTNVFLEQTRPKTSTTKSLFSSSFTSALGSLNSFNDSDPVPLTITPIKTTIEPNSRETFTVKFAPLNPLEYRFELISEVSNLHPDLTSITIGVKAAAILPLYHFRIEPSDYLSTRRGFRESCEVQVEEGTKVLEFEVIGFGIPVTKEFSIMNPTGEMFTYRWEKCVKQHNIALFQCETPEGTVMKGRSAKAAFTFIANRAGTFEMFYYFTIDEYKLRVMFLLVGHARLPCVHFNDNGVSLKPTVIGIDVHHTLLLRNTEDILLTYRVNASSLYHEGRAHKIDIEPIKGILLPKTDKTIKIHFRPSNIGQFTFNVQFIVERIEKPLIVTITAICYNIEPTVKLVREYTTTELDIYDENILEVPVLVKTIPEVCKFLIGNIGKVGFYYKWEYADQFLEDFVNLQIIPKEGYVKIGTEMESTITVKAVKALIKKNILLQLKVNYGPTVNVTLLCSTCKTRLKFSDVKHDFGACLAQVHDTAANEWILELTNNDHISYIVRLEPCNYSHLTIIKKEIVINAQETMKIYFYFHPKEIIKYNTKIYFNIDEKRHAITILGEGVSMEVELLNICNKFLNFGAVVLGKCGKKTVQIVNKTKCQVNIYFDLYHRLPICAQTTRAIEQHFDHCELKPSDINIKPTSKNEAKLKIDDKKPRTSSESDKSKLSKIPVKIKTSKQTEVTKASKTSTERSVIAKMAENANSKSSPLREGVFITSLQSVISDGETLEETQRRRINSSIRIRPQKTIKLQPQHSVEYTILYAPTERMPMFQEQIHCQVEDTVIPMCSIKAYCIAPEYSLPKNTISFNTAILGSSSLQYTKLINSGDIGGRFKWTWKTDNHEMYKIVPMEGYSSPGTTTNFEVYFEPVSVQCNCTRTAFLGIEHYKPTLELVINGTCINLPSPQETIKFSVPVRETLTKEITLRNSTPEAWIIKPVLSGMYFQIQDIIVVQAKTSETVEVTYNPITMTQANKYHQGNVFLPLPDGQGMLYEFSGESLRPKTVAVIEAVVPSKTYNDITLEVYNWMKESQQFAVINQIDQSDNVKKVLYKLTGAAIFDVPPCTSKPYKWTIYTLNEGKLKFIVKFRNEVTKEYVCFEIRLNVVKCEVLDTIVLNTCARKVAEYKLRLENPLNQPTTYTMSSPCPELHFTKKATLAPYTEAEFLIEYKPLYPTAEISTQFEAVSSTLGTFPYIFKLSASTAEPEATVTIKSPLGQKNEHNAYIHNPMQQDAEFTAKFESDEFSLERPIVIKANEYGPIGIVFEPSDLGGVHSKLTISSPTMGVYIFPLYGVGLPPQPRGPIIVKTQSPTSIPFKNPFTTAMTFQFAVSGMNFILSSDKELIKPRSTGKFTVTYKKAENVDQIIPSMFTAKLLITCLEGYAGLEWNYYLQSEKF